MATRTAGKKKNVDDTAIARLDDAVDRLLSELAGARAGAAALSAVESGSGGDSTDARSLALRIQALEGENRDLRERLFSGRGIAERLMAKIRFLEEKK